MLKGNSLQTVRQNVWVLFLKKKMSLSFIPSEDVTTIVIGKFGKQSLSEGGV